MSRKLVFDRIATTEDTNDPVIKARFPDVGSYMDFIYLQNEGIIRVWIVESHVKGDMRRMMDEVTSQLNVYDVDFLQPEVSEEQYGMNIKEVLDGFEKHEEIVTDSRTGERLKSTYLRGEWKS